jgi:hypothetical protein
MKKIFADQFSFSGDIDDAVLPRAALTTDSTLAQIEVVAAAASSGTLAMTAPGAGHMSASVGPAANDGAGFASSVDGPAGTALAGNGEPVNHKDALSDAVGGVFPNPETVTLAGSGLVFVNTYGAGVNDPFHTAIIYAEHELQSNFTNSVTIRVSFDFGNANGFLAQNSFFNTVQANYTTLKNALTSHATSADDVAAVNAFPATAPSNSHSSSGTTGFLVAAGMARVLGLAAASNNIDDALILGNNFTWNFDPNNRSAGGYDAIGAIEHEISEGGMGRVGGLGYQNNTWAPMDLFRFTSAGQRDYTGGQDGVTTYFSPNGANPDLSHPYHNSISAQGVFDGADPADWEVGGDSFGFGSPGVPGLLSSTDLRVMDILGWTRSSIDDFTANTSTTGVVLVGGSATGNLEVVGDHDWFRVQLNAGTQYTIEERGQTVGAGTLSDPFMALYNGAGQLITSNDDGAGNLNSRIVYTPTVTGNYYIDAGAYQDQSSGTYRVSVDSLFFAQPTFQFAGFGNAAAAGNWSSDDKFPRELADVNGDHLADIVGFGNSGVYVALATGGGAFGATSPQLSSFGPAAGGWSSDDKYPRELADVNGDHLADIVGFGDAGVYVSLATGGGSFGAPTFKLASFGPSAGGWSSDNKYPRELADVNGDHLADIVGFGDAGVYVSLATGGGNFAAPTFKLGSFGFNAGGWTSDDKYPRELADVNGDGMADIVGFGDSGVYVALATGGGNFGAPTFKLASFGPNAGGWSSNDQFPRELADVNLDGKIDIVGFGQAGVYVAPGNGDGTFKPVIADLQSFGTGAGGWSSENTYPRHLADINNDGAADIVGFGQAGVYEALSNGFHLV